MGKRWTKLEEDMKRAELTDFYLQQNKTIGEIAKILNLGQTTVYDRLVRLGIVIDRSKKQGYNNLRRDINIPICYSDNLAEFIGILLGDGHLTPTQVTVTLGNKDEYIDYVCRLTNSIFGIKPKHIIVPKNGHVVYFGSTVTVRWLLNMGLVFNKVKYQVDIPQWIFSKKSYMKSAIRGLIDTDGSVYKIRSGVQMSFTNCSKPLLRSFRSMMLQIGFFPSKISSNKVYLTKQADLRRYVQDIGFSNKKHENRLLLFNK
jgi:hypothetical protein